MVNCQEICDSDDVDTYLPQDCNERCPGYNPSGSSGDQEDSMERLEDEVEVLKGVAGAALALCCVLILILILVVLLKAKTVQKFLQKVSGGKSCKNADVELADAQKENRRPTTDQVISSRPAPSLNPSGAQPLRVTLKSTQQPVNRQRPQPTEKNTSVERRRRTSSNSEVSTIAVSETGDLRANAMQPPRRQPSESMCPNESSDSALDSPTESSRPLAYENRAMSQCTSSSTLHGFESTATCETHLPYEGKHNNERGILGTRM